ILSSLGLDGPGIATALLEAARRYGLAEEAEEPSVGLAMGGSDLPARPRSGVAPVHVRRRR
ncbi:MAG: hypothetical protein ACYDGN_16945, partial [Acidimicrobiales bacterium]